MRLPGRLDRLEKAVGAATGGVLRGHWERVLARRLAGFERFIAAVPDTHLDRVWVALGGPEQVAGWLLVTGPAWPGEDATAVARLAWVRSDWGDDHPFNPPLPDPVPGALLDLYLDNPAAEIHGSRCLGCRTFIPCSPAERGPGERHVAPQPLADTCPVCGTHVPPPRLC